MSRKNTSVILSHLRELMQNRTYVKEPLQAYIVPSDDAHQDEYIADRDERRKFISGFSGSAGEAIVTAESALLWTDGRYFMQATEQLDENWTLMKEGLVGTLSKGEWLGKMLPNGSKIGVDPMIISYNGWKKIQTELEPYGQELVSVKTNLIDLIWKDRPDYATHLIQPLELKYSGKSSKQKVNEVRKEMEEKKASVLLVTKLDEIAWLLNLRGSDIPYNPVFFSYVIVTKDEVFFFIDESKISNLVYDHFKTEELNVSLKKYDEIHLFLEKLLSTDEAKEGKIWISSTSSYGFVNAVPEKNRITSITPISVMKAIKNDVEIQGMINSHIRDAAALACYFDWLEKEVGKGNVTEISGATKLEQFRSEQKDYMGLSFDTISSVGSNGAIIHYKPSKETDRLITDKELYLCDSGGQYKDGTTDVTRTMHFGTPTEYEKECFTRVLKGQIFLATAIFPEKVKGNVLDTLARKFLWDVGLNYLHGTGHGVGSYLNVHEGPMGISWRQLPDDPGLQIGMVLSDEPGYYEDGKFGIRIENLVRIVKANPKYAMKDVNFLTFDSLTLVPIQRKMIERSLLSNDEICFLNEYHKTCKEKVGKLLQEQGKLDALDWLARETEPIY